MLLKILGEVGVAVVDLLLLELALRHLYETQSNVLGTIWVLLYGGSGSLP